MGRDHRRSDDIQRRIAIAQGPRKRRPHTRPRRGVALAGTPGVRTGPDAGSAPCAVARCTRFSGRMPESGGDSRRGIRTGTYDAESRREGHLRHQTVNRLMDDSGNDEIAAHSLTNNAPDAATTSQTEEFNLRQAIIYSEILKPKFEE